MQRLGRCFRLMARRNNPMKKLMLLALAAITTTALAQDMQRKSITEIAAGNADFSTLVSLLQSTGLDKTLAGAGNFTVFAPTNAAFAKVPKATLDALAKDKAELTRVLTYHVLASKALSGDVVKLDGKMVKTVEGSEVKVTIKDGKVMVNNSTVITVDILASNGVIHIIDSVLLPPAKANTMMAKKSITEIAAGNPDFSTLVSLLKATGLDKTLAGDGAFTVFAPTNAAFAKVPKATLDALAANKEQLTQVLLYHVVAGKVLSGDVVKLSGKSVKTVQGSDVKVMVAGGKVMVNDSNVTAVDIDASNGVIHVIDSVLLPPAK
jgi:transforming growth factor-beta-induced protein